MKYNTDTDQSTLNHYVEYVDKRWKQLNDLTLSLANEGIKFLFYVNAGGCVAVLTFIGTAEPARNRNWPWLILFFFFLGLIFIGILNFARYHYIDWLLNKWQSQTAIFYAGELDFDKLTEDDDDRVKTIWWIPIFAYGAFICFALGGSVGFYNYKDFINKEKVVSKQSTITDEQKRGHVPVLPKVPPPPQPPKVDGDKKNI